MATSTMRSGPGGRGGRPGRVTGGVSAIVLAGGRSSRFGADKLAALLDGRPLLHHAIEAVASIADEVIVVAAPGTEQTLPAVAVPVRIVHDATPHRGPLAGIREGAAAASGSLLVVVGGDMPTLVPGVLALLVDAVATDHQASQLADDDAVAHPLPLALRRSPVLARADPLLAAGDASLRDLLKDLDTIVIGRSAWRVHDPDGMTLRDVDRPEDLPAR